MESPVTNKTKDIVKYGEVFSTPTGNNRNRNNSVFNIDGEGIEHNMKRTSLRQRKSKLLQSGREERQRIEGNKDLVFLHAKSSTNLRIPKLSDRDCN
jgi:hypothetical protein